MKSGKIQKVKAIIWDMDGVLVDSEYLHAKAESETAKHFGINISIEKVIKYYSGVKIEKEFQDMEKRYRKKMPLDEALGVLKLILEKLLTKGIKAIPHAKKVLKDLSKEYKMGLVTSSLKYFGEVVLTKLSLSKFFSSIVYADDVNEHKPHPKPFLIAAEELGVAPNEVVAVEDSESGFPAAKAAGMILIARKAEHNKSKDFSLADFVIEDLNEIPKLLEKIKGYKGYKVTL